MIKNQLLHSLPLRELNSVFSHLQAVRLKKRVSLHDAGNPLSAVYFPDDCIASYLSTAPGGGHRTAVAIIGNEGIVGGDSLLSCIAAFDAVVQLTGAAHSISAGRLREELGNCPVLNELILRHTTALLIQIAQTAVCNKFHSLQQRVSKWLLLAQDRSESNCVATRVLLARVVGTSNTSIIWVTDTMRKDGLIGIDRGLISIRNRARLESKVCDCYQTIAAAYSRLARRATT